MPKGGDNNRDNRKAIIEIFAERSVFYRGFEIFMSGRDNSDVNVSIKSFTDRPNFSLLDDTQEFCLESQVHIADFIKKNSAALGFFKQTSFAADGAREGSLGMSEELALQ